MELSITLIQSDLHWEDRDRNLAMFSLKIAEIAEHTDLIILPEMFSTGFSMNNESLAEEMDGITVSWMRTKASERNAVICGSFICREKGKYYNRLVWMRPDGSCSTYDKRHLFSMGSEDKHYSAGESRIIETLKGWRIRPLICYDLRFPVWSRRTKAEDYDLLVYVANWPERRAYPWKTLLLARAIENQCFVAGINRTGDDGNGVHHSGDSALIDPKGEILSKLESDREGVETITIDKRTLDEFREQFPAIEDADGFRIDL